MEMEYNSFFGGRRGTPFIIKRSFESIKQMVEQFKKGYDYQEVNFEEYVIINTNNKDNPDNGKVYRRDTDYSNDKSYTYYPEEKYKIGTNGQIIIIEDQPEINEQEEIEEEENTEEETEEENIEEETEEEEEQNVEEDVILYRVKAMEEVFNGDGGAVYIGTIVGPSGSAPYLRIASYEEIDNTDASYVEGSLSTLMGMVPGKVETEDILNPGEFITSYNDSINWRSVCFRNPDGRTSTTKIGFQIPYPIIEFTTESINPYENESSTIERVDDTIHPFYEKWNIGIPKALKPNLITNLKVTTPTVNDFIYEVGDSELEYEYSGKSNDVEGEKQIITYDQIDYSNLEQGTLVTRFLGNYNVIKNVELSNQGQLTFSFTHDDDAILPTTLKWIKQLDFNEEDGNFIVTYNTKTDDENDTQILNKNTVVSWIKDLTLNDDGYITATWNSGSNKTGVINNNPIEWITDLELLDTGILKATYNTYETIQEDEEEQRIYTTEYLNIENPIKVLKNIALSETGELTATYNGFSGDEIETEVEQEEFLGTIKWVNSLNLSEDGILTTIYNDSTEQSINITPIKWATSYSLENGHMLIDSNIENDPIFEADIRWSESLIMQESGLIQILYNNGETEYLNTAENRVRFLTNLSLVNGYLQATYNNDEQQNYDIEVINNDKIKFLQSLSLDKDTGLITATYNTSTATLNPETGETILQPDVQIINEEFPFRWVTGMELSASGELKAFYNTADYGEQTTQEVLATGIVWPKNFTFDSSTGIIEATYNNSDISVALNETPIQWINNIELDEDGTLNFYNNLSDEPTQLENKIQWITGVQLSNDGYLTVNYNTEETPFTSSQQIKWIEDITLNRETGSLSIEYNTSEGTPEVLVNNMKWIDELSWDNGDFSIKLNTDSLNTPSISAQMRWIQNVTISDDGIITVIDNKNTETSINTQKPIKYIDTLTYDDNTGINIKYNTDSVAAPLTGTAFNYIKESQIAGDHHLLLLYSDQTKAAELANKRAIVNTDTNVTEYWADLGSVYEYSGILVGLYIDTNSVQNPSEYETPTDVINILNTTYPDGLEEDLAGKIVIVGASGDSSQSFYAFNYGHNLGGNVSDKSWFLLGGLSQNSSFAIAPSTDQQSVSQRAKIEALGTDGIWFVTEDWT